MYYIHKEIKNPLKDGIELAEELQNNIEDPSLMILVTSITKKEKIEELLTGLKQNLRLDNLIGCTTAGEFSENYETKQGALLLAFNKSCKVAVGRMPQGTPARENGSLLAEDINQKLTEKYPKIDMHEKFLGFVFHDWNDDDENEVIEGLSSKLSFPIIGGTAADSMEFKNMYQIYQDKVLSNHTVFGAVSPKKKFNILYGHGYEPTEYYARVTKTDGYIIEELDGKPAYEVYSKMVSNILNVPLETINKYIPNENSNLDFTILYPPGIQDIYGHHKLLFIKKIENNNIIVSQRIKEGTFLTLMKTSVQKTKESLIHEIQKKTRGFKLPFTFIIECVARKIIKNPKAFEHPFVSEDFEKWISPNENILNEKEVFKTCIGFNSYGESIVNGVMRFHNALTFTGVSFDLESTSKINWKSSLKYFEFSEEELKIILELIDSRLSAKDLLKRLDLSQTKLYATLNDLEDRNIIKSQGKNPKKYYIENILKVLKDVSDRLDCQYQYKKEKRNKLLSKF
ncbi:transcriptional regulator, TrmB [Methanococcus aeolicus Nankai-3]|uniref:Transcriptional regulator, TrmB n=1 Tax=Methanococcus aeolicus (strain ATCC BAA-1280 / DSM 17508 / OCM 812 / Nankai-3) TaxID=419665 RepID=A6UUV7_META3|nr:FIST N-terminal domain-containing protein [Methanococcus aeolicus]ABR56279.1 transcriptional regulator, TrmB [Methanococcus aeolicus Nankai-3]